MKISAERLKKIIKEEVQHVREIGPEYHEPSTGTPDDTWNALKSAHTEVVKIAEEMYGLVNPDAPPESPHYQVGDILAKELQEVGKKLDGLLENLAEGIKEPRR